MVYALEIEILDPVFYSVNPFFHDWVPSTGFGCDNHVEGSSIERYS